MRRDRPSTLAGLETLLRLVEDVYAALATHQAIVAVAIAQGLEGIADFHGFTRISDTAGQTHGRRVRRCYARIEPGDQGGRLVAKPAKILINLLAPLFWINAAAT